MRFAHPEYSRGATNSEGPNMINKKNTYTLIASVLIIITALCIIKQSYKSAWQKNNLERTLAMIKPNAVLDKNVGNIITRIEQNEFNIVAIKKEYLTKERAKKFYAEHKKRPFFKDLVAFMTSGPIYALVLEKKDAISEWRNLMDTLRKLYGKNITENAVHGSDAIKSAKKEIAFFFPKL